MELTKQLFSILTISALLAACGGGIGENSEGAIGGSSGENVSLNSFEVIGTSAPINGVIPINANLNEGRFQIKWKASYDGSIYRSSVYLSKDARLDKNSDDLRLFYKNCGSSPSLYDCGNTANFSCQFKTNNSLLCSLGRTGMGRVIGNWLGALPQKIYMILEVCNGLGTQCKTRANHVILQ